MIIFLYGQDSYRLKQNLQKVVLEYGKKNTSGTGLVEVDLVSGDGVAVLAEAVRTVSFFDEKKLVIAKNVFAAAAAVQELVKTHQLLTDQQVILVALAEGSAGELGKKAKKFFTLLTTKPVTVKECKPLSGKQLANWLIAEAAARGVELVPVALQQLVESAGNDSWRLSQELNKLANYVLGSGQTKIDLSAV